MNRRNMIGALGLTAVREGFDLAAYQAQKVVAAARRYMLAIPCASGYWFSLSSSIILQ